MIVAIVLSAWSHPGRCRLQDASSSPDYVRGPQDAPCYLSRLILGVARPLKVPSQSPWSMLRAETNHQIVRRDKG
jgi:hypothetical protein